MLEHYKLMVFGEHGQPEAIPDAELMWQILNDKICNGNKSIDEFRTIASCLAAVFFAHAHFDPIPASNYVSNARALFSCYGLSWLEVEQLAEANPDVIERLKKDVEAAMKTSDKPTPKTSEDNQGPSLTPSGM